MAPISALSAKNVIVHNLTPLATTVSINNGDFFTIPAFESYNSLPFSSISNPGQGEIGLGENAVTIYARSFGPSRAQNFTINVPTTVRNSDGAHMIITPKTSYSTDYGQPQIYFFH